MYGLEINRSSSLSISKQLQNQIRTAILEGKLSAGENLPPSRNLAKELGISRNTVVQVYEQLIAEGYLDTVVGAGTYVVDIGKLAKPKSPKIPLHTNEPDRKEGTISFNAGNPDSVLFPNARWSSALKQACSEQTKHSYPQFDFAGNVRLRKAISNYVFRAKGIDCDHRQIVITSGTAGALDLIAKTLKKRNSRILIEDPCIDFVKKIFSCYDYRIQPVPVDDQGIDIKYLKSCPDADLIYVVPSHQYPIGGVLPAVRRIALLQYANEQNSYIIEDDYDCEFRYSGEPLQPLRNLDPERVIYCGSFSKIFSPTLRIGYLILPYSLCTAINQMMDATNLWVNPTIQLALANFLEQKYMDKHVYKMKKVYERKRRHLMDCIQRTFGTSVEMSGEYAGLHLLFRFERDFTEKDAEAFRCLGVDAEFVEEYSVVKGKHKNELVLGYGNLSFEEIEEGVKRLKAAIYRE